MVSNIEVGDIKTAPVWKLIEGVINTLQNIYSCEIARLDDEDLRQIMFSVINDKCKSEESWGNYDLLHKAS